MKKKSSKRTKKEKKGKKKVGLIILIIILLILAILGGIFAKRVYDLDGNWLAALLGHNKNTLENLDKLYVLAMGESTGLSDTIIVFAYDPKVQEASMLSIPRDTFVDNDSDRITAYNKINAVYNNGKNPEKTLEAVNEITGLDIKNYVLIDTKALVELVDTIGGIEYDVPMDMHYTDKKQNLYIDLKKGKQKLNGSQVEQLVRFRHNKNGSTYSYEYGMEDLGRMKTQRNVIKEIFKQTVQFKNIKDVFKILDIAEKYVQTNMDMKELKDYIPYAIELDADNIRTEQLPGIPKYIKGISFFVHDDEKTKALVDEIFNGIKPEQNEEENENNVVSE